MRSRTSDAHAAIDHAFGAYDLSDHKAYVTFLLAHARALPTAEAIIARCLALPPSRPRTPSLVSDLVMLECVMPPALTFDGSTCEAVCWGFLYVVEGSRLGGAILAKRVGAGLPTTYLASLHQAGEWRAFATAIEVEAMRHDAAWLDDAVRGAHECFDLYRRAAQEDRPVVQT